MKWFTLIAFLSTSLLGHAGILEDYIKKENPALAYKIEKEAQLVGVKAVSVRLTSQEWRGKKWQHWLTIFIPPVVDPHKRGILLIEGGRNQDGLPDPRSQAGSMLGMSSISLRAPLALLLQVPNQPNYGNLYEDDLIAHTFDKYLKGGDDEWPLLLPMVKSATAAMDALQMMAKKGELKTSDGKALALEQFVVAGASKRGWTSWLTAAVDKRVCALAPSVIDVLNMKEQMKLQSRSYGKFSHMIEPYTKRNIMKRLDSPRGELLRKVVDPYEYRDRIKQPKLMLLGTNDPYWIADAARLYYGDLQGPKAMYYLPNAGHGLGLGILPTLTSFFLSALNDKPYPEVKETIKDGKLTVTWPGKGKAALWWAAADGRDFRKAEWNSIPLEGDGKVTVDMVNPKKGWWAAYVSVTFPGLRKTDSEFQLSTPIKILPETFPTFEKE